MFMMNVLKILLILGCIGVYANNRQTTKECFEIYGINFDELMKKHITKEQMINEITPYRLGCIAVCYLKKKPVDEISMKKHILDSLNNAPPIYGEAEVDEMKDIANKCIIEANGDECKLLECLKPWDTEIGRIIGIP